MATVQRVIGQAVTVGELIEELRTFPETARVVFACNYGDIGKTQQALPVSDCDEYGINNFRESGYSESGVALENECEGDEGESVVVLS